MQRDWWWDVNTLLFNCNDLFRGRIVAEEEFLRVLEHLDDGLVPVLADVIKINALCLAVDAIVSTWCRRGDAFMSGIVDDCSGEFNNIKMAAYGALLPTTNAQALHQLDSVIRCCFIERMRGNLHWPTMFRLWQQWYSFEVQPSGKELAAIMPDFTATIIAPRVRCTFKPWALHTGTNGGLAFFNE